MSDKKSVFTTGEIAKMCGVSLRTVVNWIQQGKLASYKLPGTRGDNRIKKEVLLAFLKGHGMPIPASVSEMDRAKRVLVVDDDPAMAKSIARLLKLRSVEVSVAYDGFDAGAQFVQLKPHLVTLDLNMPMLNGMSVLKKLKAEQADIKVVVVSGEGEDALNAALDAGADAVFAKPFESEALLEQVFTLLEE